MAVVRIPRGALWGVRGARAIAGDSRRLEAAAVYWRNAFEDIGIKDISNLSHRAITLGESVPDTWFSLLHPDRERLIAGCDAAYLVRRTGCLVSLEEIAHSIAPSLNAKEMLVLVEIFLSIGLPGAEAVPPEIAVSGLLAVREIFDLVRRFRICRWSAEEFNLPLSELLSLYRQEGALCITPPCESYPHAPLIRTGIAGREEHVTLFDDSCSRPGFNLVYSFLSNTDAVRTENSLRFDLLFRNLVVLGGLDSVVLPRLHPHDELSQFWRRATSARMASAGIKLINEKFRTGLANTALRPFNAGWKKTQRQFFDELCIGLLRVSIESRDQSLIAEELLDDLWLTAAGLFSAHTYEPERPWSKGNVWLSTDIDATDTYACLRIQSRWYASRKRLMTLLSWKDRSGGTAALSIPQLNSFMTYLRFHVADAIFVGLLLRVISRFDFLKKSWEKNSASWGTIFLEAIPKSGISADVAEMTKALRGHWATRRVQNETAWQNIGLIETLLRSPDPPAWLRFEVSSNSTLIECARIARLLVEFLSVPGVLKAVSAALEYTPVFWLAMHGFTPHSDVRGTDMLVKSHSFERIRLVYSQAAREAGIE